MPSGIPEPDLRRMPSAGQLMGGTFDKVVGRTSSSQYVASAIGTERKATPATCTLLGPEGPVVRLTLRASS